MKHAINRLTPLLLTCGNLCVVLLNAGNAAMAACNARILRPTSAINLYSGSVIDGSLLYRGTIKANATQFLKSNSSKPDLICFRGGYCYPAKDLAVDCMQPDETGYAILSIPN